MHLANSLMVSADNAHAVHPNYTEKADPTNRPYLNEGIVIKYNANQKYCTDAVSAAMFKDICHTAGVPVQTLPTVPIWQADPHLAIFPTRRLH